AEQAARAEAERQRGELERVFEQAPVAIAVYRGPKYTIELANATVARLWGRTREQLLGKGLFEALPEVAGMGYEQLLDGVMATGIPHVAHAMEAQHDRNGQRETVYWDFVYVPLYGAEEQINGAMVVATEVTAQVRARQQIEQLNQELEARVQARTRELAEQERLLQQILAQVPAAITTLRGPEHRYTFANARYQQLVEHRVQVGQTVAETLPEVAEQGFMELLDNAYNSGQFFEGKEIAVLLAQPAGPPAQHYLDFTYQPMPDEHGQPQGILVFAVDVTEQVRTRRQAETMQAALLAVAQRRAQERQDRQALFEQAPVAVALLREPDHQLDYYNSRFAQLFPGTDLKGRTVQAAYPTLASMALFAQLDHVYQTGETYQGTEVVLPTTTAGPARYITFTCQAYYEHGHIVGVAVFVHEVSEQVRARQAVEATARQLRLITDALPVLIGYLDRQHIYRFANRAYQDWFGQTPAALIGQPVREVVGEAAYQTALPHMQQALTGERVDFDARMPYRADFVKHIHTSYIPDEQAGEVVGFYTLVVDITEQVLARQQVQELNQELAAINQELAAINEELTATNEELHASNAQLLRTNADLDTFVYAASHDLKAPIANIEGLLDVLAEYLPPGEQQPLVPRLVAMMQGAIHRFQQTVGHLTDVARLQHAADSEAHEVDVPRLLEDVRLDVLPLLESTQAQLHTQVARCPRVRLPAKNMRSILFNLLSNALKYRAPDRPPVVQVRSFCTATHFTLTVQDNGLGLSEEQQGKLFTMFRRLHTHVEGSGVGLYLIRRMIELAGGHIAVQSQLGVGSTFTVTLPRTDPF
ncbi:PAS domain-containing protein, partial [Hymenobacter sp. YC55]|uniref:PAS domain-containing sensor histidine kinase n=1 Tax=Hymenobacter sp. YC55 TaxID=3034019 RepID=UPI0023F99ADB